MIAEGKLKRLGKNCAALWWPKLPCQVFDLELRALCGNGIIPPSLHYTTHRVSHSEWTLGRMVGVGLLYCLRIQRARYVRFGTMLFHPG